MILAAALGLVFRPSLDDDLGYLRQVAREVVGASRVDREASIPGVGKNQTGFVLRVPGGTQTYYPAFWIRDAAMMLGADLVPADEVEGWIRLVTSTQPDRAIDFPHGLHIPPRSIPDHVTLRGEACWFPGAYADQGVGDFGFLPPADDAFYFIQMVDEHSRLTGRPPAWSVGKRTALEAAVGAFDSVEVEDSSQLVIGSSEPGKGRVDWGFCDSITKTGKFLMPSLLRWQAVRRLARLCEWAGDAAGAARFRSLSAQITESIADTFWVPGHKLLISATGIGRKDDVWASAFAVAIGALPKAVERVVSQNLVELCIAGGTVREGQVRHLPPTGDFGGYWEQAKSGRDTYQNGGFWATPLGWLAVGVSKVDQNAAHQLVQDFVAHVRRERAQGAPFEWTNPATGARANGNYGSSAGLVYIVLRDAGWYRKLEAR